MKIEVFHVDGLFWKWRLTCKGGSGQLLIGAEGTGSSAEDAFQKAKARFDYYTARPRLVTWKEAES
jgi:hypothetical protein